MEDSPKLFGLSGAQIAEFDLSIEHAAGAAIVKTRTGELFRIVNQLGVTEPRDQTKYFVSACYSGYSLESQIVAIKDRKTDKTLGYVFPVTSMRTGDRIEDGWPKKYADVGFRALTTVEALSYLSPLTSLDAYRGRDVFLDEVVSDSLGILVIGIENLNVSVKSLEVVELCLLKAGIALLKNTPQLENCWVADAWKPSIYIERPSDIVMDEVAVFVALVRGADADASGVGAFIYLYQIMEFCIDHVFSWGVSELSTGGLKTWDLRQRLAEITNERYRLGLLEASCLSSLRDRANFRLLELRCVEFLTQLGIESSENGNWFVQLYSVRNVIIHNHIRIMKAGDAKLSELNRALRLACLDVLFAFAKPPAPLFAFPAGATGVKSTGVKQSITTTPKTPEEETARSTPIESDNRTLLGRFMGLMRAVVGRSP